MNNLENVRINLITSDAMLSNVLDKDVLESARNSNETENIRTSTNTTVVLNPVLRDFYKDAYKKLESVGENVLLAKRKMIVAVMASDDFKQSFVNDADFAESIGESKTFISKAKSCISTLNWLVDNGYTSDWSASQLDEITPTLNKSLKADKAESLNTMLSVLYEHGVFNTALSARKIRELLADIVTEYNKLIPQAEENQAEENQAEENQAEENQAEENQTEENQAEENQAEENQAEENQAEENQKSSFDDEKYGIAQFTLSAKLNCGMTISIEGNCKKGKKGDKTYNAIKKAVETNPEVMEMLKNVLQSIIQ